MRALRVALEWVDGMLDNIPSYEQGHWYWHGGWGCRAGLHRWWWDDADYEPVNKPTPSSPATADGRRS